jgi:PhnB protein
MSTNAVQVSPYINFQGEAREAMEFYQAALGGTVDLEPAGDSGRVASARLVADGAVIVGSDGHPDYPARVGENVALSLHGSDRERLATAFAALGAGGQVRMPLAKQPWGGEVGWLADRFGILWTVSVQGRE